MGFTVAGPDLFYTSGHPGPGVEMANPLGLIQSTDAGQSWTPRSRQNQSDVHTLTASQDSVTGYDGTAVLTTTDGRQWSSSGAWGRGSTWHRCRWSARAGLAGGPC